MESRFLGIDDAGRPFEGLAAVAGKLDDAALRGEVSVKDRVAAAWLDRIGNRPYHVLRVGRRQRVELLEKGPPGDRREILDQAGGSQFARHQRRPSVLGHLGGGVARSDETTSDIHSLMRSSNA